MGIKISGFKDFPVYAPSYIPSEFDLGPNDIVISEEKTGKKANFKYLAKDTSSGEYISVVNMKRTISVEKMYTTFESSLERDFVDQLERKTFLNQETFQVKTIDDKGEAAYLVPLSFDETQISLFCYCDSSLKDSEIEKIFNSLERQN